MKIKVPKISKPKEWVDVEFIDEGESWEKIKGDEIKVVTSVFRFSGRTYRNMIDVEIMRLSEGFSYAGAFRYKQDCAFLKKYDLCLAKGIFE